MAIKDWSTTAADNDDADATINWTEGQAPSTVNGSARSMMAAIKQAFEDTVFAVDYGVAADGTTDDTSSLQSACDAASGKTLLLPAGTIKLSTNTGVVLTGAVRIVGHGTNATTVSRAFDGSAAAKAAFAIGPSANGTCIENMTISTPTGVTGGSLISIVATTSPVGLIKLDTLNLTTAGTDTHDYTVYIDGSAATSAPQGVRSVEITDCAIFGAAQRALYIKGAKTLAMKGGGLFSAGGTSTIPLEITGDATVTSQYVNIDVGNIGGSVALDRLDNCIIKAGEIGTNITNTSNVTDTVVIAGALTGTAQNNWLRSCVIEAGRYTFPATQNSSSNVNTLDDYEEGSWTPVITFATPGDLSVTYLVQAGRYTKIGDVVTVVCAIQTSAFTHSSASGNLTITGFPFAALNVSNLHYYCPLSWQGITKGTFTDYVVRLTSGGSSAIVLCSASATGVGSVGATDMPTGGTVVVNFTMTYKTTT